MHEERPASTDWSSAIGVVIEAVSAGSVIIYYGLFAMLNWNIVMPRLFPALPPLNIWQAIALSIVARSFIGGRSAFNRDDPYYWAKVVCLPALATAIVYVISGGF